MDTSNITFFAWLSSTISSAALIGLAGYLARNFIQTRLVKSVQFEFDKKLAALNSQLRTSEEAFKVDLRRKETEIQTLQAGALTNRAVRAGAVEKRKLEAIDQLWEAFHGLSYARGAATWMSVVKFEAMSKEAAKNPKARQLFEGMKTPPDKGTGPIALAQKARPFVSSTAWAYYYAYQSMVLFATTQVNMLAMGVDMHEVLDTKNVINLVKTALPHAGEYLDKHGSSGAFQLLGQLEDRLMAELKKMMDGTELDIAEVQRSQQIVKEASRLSDSAVSSSLPSGLPQELKR